MRCLQVLSLLYAGVLVLLGYKAGYDDGHRSGRADGYLEGKNETLVKQAHEEHQQIETGELLKSVKNISAVSNSLEVSIKEMQESIEQLSIGFNNQFEITKLSSPEFADSICKELSSQYAVYEAYLDMQQVVIQLLCKGADPELVLDAARNNMLRALLYGFQMKGFDTE